MDANRVAGEVARAVARLSGTAGRRIARRNARRDLRALLRAIRRDADREFPAITKDGSERARPLGCTCPVCCQPQRSFTKLAHHAIQRHGLGRNGNLGLTDQRCWCGFRPRLSSTSGRPVYLRICAAIGRHLAAQPDLAAHVMVCGLGASQEGGQHGHQ